MEMTNLVSFELQDGHIQTPRSRYYFFRVQPPNYSTLDEKDKGPLFKGFEEIMRLTADIPFRIFACDRTVRLNDNRHYIQSISDDFTNIKQAVMTDINSFEEKHGNTERAFYFILQSKKVETREQFQGMLRAAGIRTIPCNARELASVMRCFLLREFVDEDIFLPVGEEQPAAYSQLVRHLLPSYLQINENYIAQPNFLRCSFVVRNLPQNITDGNRNIFQKLMLLPGTTMTMHISSMGGQKVKELVEKQLNNNFAGLFRKRNTDRLEAQGDYDNLQKFYQDCLKDAGRGGAVKYLNLFIEVYGKDEKKLSENIIMLTNACESLGMTIEKCNLRQKQGFLGVSPIGYDTWGKMMANNIPSSTFGRLYPFSASSLIDPNGLPLGRTAELGAVLLDIWIRDIVRTNSNIAIIGESGQGKSYLMKKIIALQYAIGTGLLIVDSDNEYADLTSKLGGTNVDCSLGKYGINPLQVRAFRVSADEDETADDDFDPDVDAFKKGASPFYQHLSWLRDFFKIALPGITIIQLAALMILVQDVYLRFSIDDRTNFVALNNEDYPIFSDVYAYIDDVLDHREKYSFYKMIDDSVLKDLMLLLHEICFGALKPIFNMHTVMPNSRLINLNIQTLHTGSEEHLQAVLFNYLTYYWGRVTSRQGQLILALDELYLFLNRDNPTVAKYLNSFNRRARKYEGCLITGTQKLGDCLDRAISVYTVAIFDTPTYKFLFYPGNLDFELMKEKLHLTSGEISCISSSKQRNCLLKIGNVDKYHMTVGTLSFEAEMFGAGGGR